MPECQNIAIRSQTHGDNRLILLGFIKMLELARNMMGSLAEQDCN